MEVTRKVGKYFTDRNLRVQACVRPATSREGSAPRPFLLSWQTGLPVHHRVHKYSSEMTGSVKPGLPRAADTADNDSTGNYRQQSQS
jgi:hypothetical protein